MMTNLRAWMRDRSRSAWSFGAACLAVFAGALSGCATRGDIDMLEARLRSQERMIREYERRTAELNSDLTASQRELDILRSNLADQGAGLHEEQTHALAQVEGIVFNSLMTAGQNLDELPGDDVLHVVFYPHDSDQELVKLSGQIEIEVMDLALEQGQRTIGHWSYSPDEARQLWHAGFLSSGFQVQLPWQRPPTGQKLLVLARFTTLDDREFQANLTVPVHPPHPGDVHSRQLQSHPPQQIVPAGHHGEEHSLAPDHPVPEPDLSALDRALPTNEPTGRPAVADDRDASADSEQGEEPMQTVESPRPFPQAIPTSDRWTDESRPIVR